MMTKKKSLFDYAILALFVMCMCLAFFAAMIYATRAQQRESLLHGEFFLLTLAIAVILFAMMRFEARMATDIPPLFKRIFEVVVVIGMLVLGFVLRFGTIKAIPLETASDFDTYYNIAAHLTNDTLLSRAADGYREYISQFPHTAGFPMLILRPIFSWFGISIHNALMANLALNMGSMVLVYYIVRRNAGRFAGLIALTLISLWPSHILYGTMVASEPAFTFFILLATAIASAAMRRDKSSLYERAPIAAILLLLVVGIVLGIAGAIRPMAILLLGAMVFVIMTMSRPPKTAVDPGATQILNRGWLCALLIVIPYILTSTILSQQTAKLIGLKPASGLSASGYNLMVGLNTKSNGIWNQEDADFFSTTFHETNSATQAHQASIQVAIRRLQSQPEDVMNLMVYKFEDLWRTDEFGIDWNLLWAEQQGTLTDTLKQDLEALRVPTRFLYLWLIMLCMLGAMAKMRSQLKIPFLFHVCIIFFLGTALSHMLLETQVRYHYNMIPYLIMLAAMTLSSWRTSILEQPPEKIVIRNIAAEETEAKDDHSHFDIGDAIEKGHVSVTVSEAYKDEKTDHSIE